MITFDIDKEKLVTVEADIQGIRTELLTFALRLDINGVEYGFIGTYDDGQISITIPSLRNIVGPSIESGTYKARLEASCLMEDKSGYYNLLQNDDVKVKVSPSIKVNVDSDDPAQKVETKVVTIKDEDIINPPAPEVVVDSSEKQTPTERPKKKLLGWL